MVGHFPLIQRAPLDPNKLNLVGERHNKGRRRRRNEFRYARAHGGPYWTEKRFAYNNNRGRLIYGDPKEFIIAYRLEYLVRQETAYTQQNANYPIAPLNLMVNRVNRLLQDINNQQKFPYNNNEIAQMGRLLQDVSNQANRLAQRQNNETPAQHDARRQRGTPRLSIILLNLTNYYSQLSRINVRQGVTALRELRSEKMMSAAAYSPYNTGLWMVGDRHITDIRNFIANAGPRGLNTRLRARFAQQVQMQDRLQFEPDFQQWLLANP